MKRRECPSLHSKTVYLQDIYGQHVQGQEMFALDPTFVDQCPLCGLQLQHQECVWDDRKGLSLKAGSASGAKMLDLIRRPQGAQGVGTTGAKKRS